MCFLNSSGLVYSSNINPLIILKWHHPRTAWKRYDRETLSTLDLPNKGPPITRNFGISAWFAWQIVKQTLELLEISGAMTPVWWQIPCVSYCTMLFGGYNWYEKHVWLQAFLFVELSLLFTCICMVKVVGRQRFMLIFKYGI